MNRLLHRFPVEPENIPAVMPSPFDDAPHPLARQAALLLQNRLAGTFAWPGEYKPEKQGKMFGVLVVRDKQGQPGFLCAFSGMMGGLWQLPGFVPPLFNQPELDAFLREESNKLAELSRQLDALENAPERRQLAAALAELEQQREQALAELKHQHKMARAERRQQRLAAQNWSDTDKQAQLMADLALASQRHKREAIDASQHWQERICLPRQQLEQIEQPIAQISAERSGLSRRMHQQVFAAYRLRNRLGEQQPITAFFPDSTPPAGAGDCAGPKLLHYALQQHLQPLAMAEFWWGASPSAGVRHHGQFYPACRGKCLPILPFMLRGLQVDSPPDHLQEVDPDEPQLILEDEHLLVVNKPAGLMSTPGKTTRDSVQWRLQQRYPDCPELRLVHRLDMATSGLLLVAKTLDANKSLQRQFISHRVEKCYEALLSKRLPDTAEEGVIELPLRVDFDDRPRQMVCFKYGKQAITRWQIIERLDAQTRIRFYPQTGRSHQLRMHASHRDGLNAPIVGDALYGQPADRMMLHAGKLSFMHPLTRRQMSFESPAPF